MKTAAKVFIIIGIVISVIMLITSIVCIVFLGISGVGYAMFGLYSTFVSWGALDALKSESRKKIIVYGIFMIPVIFLASIFMFCIPKDQLH